jgi:hypothetical protein
LADSAESVKRAERQHPRQIDGGPGGIGGSGPTWLSLLGRWLPEAKPGASAVLDHNPGAEHQVRREQ